MEKNNSAYFNQAAIEKAFKDSKERGNYFIEFNRSVILNAIKNSVDNDETLLDRLKEIQSTIDSNEPLTVDQYTLIGSFAYFYGMDFSGQGFLHLNICEFVAERFAKLFDAYEFTDLEIQVLYNIFKSIRESNITKPKDDMKSGILELIKLNSEDSVVLKTIIFPGLKSIIGNSIIPINLAKEYTDLKSGGDMTYQTLAKYNTLINQDCHMLGKSIKTYCSVYSQPLYAHLLNESLVREEKTKFALMYLDSIISLQEAIARMDLTIGTFADLTINIEGLKANYDFDNAETKFNEKFKSDNVDTQVLEEKSKESYVPKISNDELSVKFAKYPDLIIAAYLEEIAKSNVITTKIFLEIVDKLTSTENEELLQHVYQYMSTNMKTEVDTSENYYPLLNYPNLFESIDEQIKDSQDKYREIAEFICQPIPEDKIARVITYINDIIGCLVLTDSQQKQYLISQYAENNISTYNQLQQIISLIENAKIFGSDSITYATLYNYLNDNENFTEVFEKAKGLTALENRISVFTKFKEWFGRYSDEESQSDTPNIEIPK